MWAYRWARSGEIKSRRGFEVISCLSALDISDYSLTISSVFASVTPGPAAPPRPAAWTSLPRPAASLRSRACTAPRPRRSRAARASPTPTYSGCSAPRSILFIACAQACFEQVLATFADGREWRRPHRSDCIRWALPICRGSPIVSYCLPRCSCMRPALTRDLRGRARWLCAPALTRWRELVRRQRRGSPLAVRQGDARQRRGLHRHAQSSATRRRGDRPARQARRRALTAQPVDCRLSVFLLAAAFGAPVTTILKSSNTGLPEPERREPAGQRRRSNGRPASAPPTAWRRS